MYEITPIREPGYVDARRVLNATCIAARLRTTRDAISPGPRLRTTDWPLKMDVVGAATMVVTPVARFPSASSSLRVTRSAARYAAVIAASSRRWSATDAPVRFG